MGSSGMTGKIGEKGCTRSYRLHLQNNAQLLVKEKTEESVKSQVILFAGMCRNPEL